jgi:hypothetical protein
LHIGVYGDHAVPGTIFLKVNEQCLLYLDSGWSFNFMCERYVNGWYGRLLCIFVG